MGSSIVGVWVGPKWVSPPPTLPPSLKHALVWKGPDDITNLKALVRHTPIGATLTELEGWVTGDHRIFMAISGVRPARTVSHSHLVCVCSAKPHLSTSQKVPRLPHRPKLFTTRTFCPLCLVRKRSVRSLHSARILATQLLNIICRQLREIGIYVHFVSKLKQQQ